MGNLYSGKIKSNGKYVDLSAVTGVTFVDGNDYQIQFLNQGYIREGIEGSGFFMTSIEPFSLRYKGEAVYVCSTKELGINIAE